MDTRHADGVDWERRSALVLGLASMSAAVVGQGREAIAQQTNAAGRQDVGTSRHSSRSTSMPTTKRTRLAWQPSIRRAAYWCRQGQ